MKEKIHKVEAHDDEITNANKNFYIRGDKGFLVNPLSSKMKDDVKKTGIVYNLNSDHFRSDEFIKKHKNKHILFAGCSNTFGEGVEYEKTWAYRLYKEISKEEELSGYFNLGASGASIFETLVNVQRYIRKYSMPDVIFLLFPEIERDIRYFAKPEISLTTIISELYKEFEYLCKKSNTLLLSTSWLNMDEEEMAKYYTKEYSSYVDYKTRDNKYAEGGVHDFLKEINPYYELATLQKNSSTFKVLYQKDFKENIYNYSLLVNNKDILVAPDSGKHHGEGFHYAWFKYFYSRYTDEQ
jgi:hypothetical protein